MEIDTARVLVVDDNADMREHLRHLLTRWWDVEAASDGQSAVDAVRRSKPDLIIADVMMPRLDGIGLVSALRSDPDLLDVPVILLSARAEDEAPAEGLRAGATIMLSNHSPHAFWSQDQIESLARAIACE